FENLALHVEVRITDSGGKVTVPLASDLNAHLKRMRRAGEALWPENEWQCTYAWGDPEVEAHAVPFIRGTETQAQETLKCWTVARMPDAMYEIDVRCDGCPSAPMLKARLSLSSGPK